jgi:hypothetical protein
MTPSELDTLADYVEGLLDGTAEGDAVTARIATDPTWADAYQQLAVANPEVTSALQRLADPPLPPEVAAKIELAMAIEREESVRPSPQPVRRLKRRRSVQIGGWAAAAAVVALVTVTAVAALHSSQSSSSSSDSAASAPRAARVSGSVAPESVRRSGFHYAASGLGPQARKLLEPTTEAAPARSSASPKAAPAPNSTSPPAANFQVSSALARLAAPSALGSCLAALNVANPLAVDYATFDGAPAVVIVTAGVDASRLTVLAAGPNCGLNGETDQLARVNVTR